MISREDIRAELLRKARSSLLPYWQENGLGSRIAQRYSGTQLDEILVLCEAMYMLHGECQAWWPATAAARREQLAAFEQALAVATDARDRCGPLLPKELLDLVGSGIELGASLLVRYPMDGSGEDENNDPEIEGDRLCSLLVGSVVEVTMEIRRVPSTD